MSDPIVGMTQEGEPIRAKDFGYVSYDDVEMKGTFNAPPTEPDDVEHPGHYTYATLPNGTPVECIDVIEALNMPYHLGNVLKYMWRHNHHLGGRVKSLKKARWYLDRYITLLEKAQ
jgi:hypothetical protein